jgi:uncharacterized protein
MTDIGLPFRFDSRGRTAEPAAGASAATADVHLRELIEQVLFTSPGERVNRPDFGSGLLQLVFAPNGGTLASATEFLVRGALQQWLGDLVQVEEVRVEAEDSTVRVTVEYLARRTQQREAATFIRQGGPP